MSATRKSIVKCTGHSVTVTPVKEDGKGGNPQIILDLLVLEDGHYPAGTERRHRLTIWDEEKSPVYAVEAMRALGMTNTDIYKPEGLNRLKAVWVEKLEMFNGKDQWQGKYINKFFVQPKLDKDAHQDLADRMAALFADQPVIEAGEGNLAPDTVTPSKAPETGDAELDF